MKTRNKIWLGVGAFVVAGTSAIVPAAPNPDSRNVTSARNPGDLMSETSLPRIPASSFVVAQHAKHGGEGGEGEGGEKGAGAKLPPDLDFALKIAQMRGHLLVGDELVKEGQWAAALPHFLHPTEELYGGVRGRLKDYKTPPFQTALKILSNTVKAKKGGDEYAKAKKAVEDAFAAADAGLKEKHADWQSFTVETAIEVLKTSGGEYEEAIVKGRIAKPVEYQDARGFIWHAEKMLNAVAPGLEKKDATAWQHLREAIADMKKAFPTAMPPKRRW
jgi:hypothetical protein